MESESFIRLDPLRKRLPSPRLVIFQRGLAMDIGSLYEIFEALLLLRMILRYTPGASI
jgi:hypothetical protein